MSPLEEGTALEGTSKEEDIEDQEMEDSEETEEATEKKNKTGILFMPTIPPYMTVTILREMLGQFGEIGRVYLQEDERAVARFKKVRRFSEGWVEFKSKRKAKMTAEMLNNQRMCDRKKSKFYDYMWSLKYLPRFKWAHLSERLAYERAVHRQRVRTEISQAKKEATHFQLSLERSEKLHKLEKKQKIEPREGFEVPQRKLDSEHKKKKKKKKGKVEENRTEVISSLFG
ncbi:activator of basal transcription 1-like [Neocloeon triangulifer]|uniref:activator of basal transcription 1-like n=1 Tax=Neocloeon triangulifer TaxID=2078957 RepID=UPI00286F554E|nr:activator of basal transcription 1-like [Neocloeon triangulifer]